MFRRRNQNRVPPPQNLFETKHIKRTPLFTRQRRLPRPPLFTRQRRRPPARRRRRRARPARRPRRARRRRRQRRAGWRGTA